MFDPSEYPAAQPHDAIEAIVPDLFMVHGSIRLAPGMRINRNMMVLRRNGELSLISPIRLVAKEEGALEALGTIKHVMRLGYYHGIDDRYYVDRYSAQFWCQAKSVHYPEPKPGHVLGEHSILPTADTELFCFQETKFPECALLLRQHGGILITCDSIQHWTDWSYCSLPARLVMRLAGFSLTTLIGPLWRKYMTPPGGSIQPDFQRLLSLEFEHLVGAHGRVCHGGAHGKVKAAVGRTFSG